jgi:AcrR family transcriptional regulator
MNKKVEKGQATRQRLVDIATQLFASAGYEATSIEAVLQAAGISRGALYHHFDTKEALFEAVLDAVEAQVALRLGAATHGIADPIEATRAAWHAWLGMAGDPVVRRIVLLDAPAAVGWAKWREIDARHGFGGLKRRLAALAAQGRLREDLLEIYSHMLLAALMEAALVIARSDDFDRALRAGRDAVDGLLMTWIASAGK